MKYDIGQRFYRVEKHYISRIMREYRTDENGVRWYREKPQNYKVVIQEYEIVAHKRTIITGETEFWSHERHDEYVIVDVARTDDYGTSAVEPEWFNPQNGVFFSREEADEYAKLLKRPYSPTNKSGE